MERVAAVLDAAIDPHGKALGNRLAPNNGNNLLNGSWRADTMFGGLGDDVYYVYDAGDVVIEGSSEGNDIVASMVSFTLSANVEQLTLFGDAAIDATGNDLANSVSGNGAANRINGRQGNDSLWGGAGGDTFVFDTALSASANVDRIIDFSAVDDTIALSRSVFSAFAVNGTLDASGFRAGSAAQDADDRIVYDSATGNIYYDADGSSGGAAVLFAQVTAGTALTSSDFSIIG